MPNDSESASLARAPLLCLRHPDNEFSGPSELPLFREAKHQAQSLFGVELAVQSLEVVAGMLFVLGRDRLAGDGIVR